MTGIRVCRRSPPGANTGTWRRGFDVRTAEGGPLEGVPEASSHWNFLKLKSLEMGFLAFWDQVDQCVIINVSLF